MTINRIAIATDSTASIPADLVNKYKIHVIPEILNWEGESLLDDIDIQADEFYKRLKTAKEMPSTSQPSAGEFLDFFTKIGESADSIVGIFLSDDLSGTLDSARTAAKMIEDMPIEIVDSRTTSMGLGFMVLEAAKAVEDGKDQKEVAKAAQALVDKVKVIFVVDTLEFLHRGGRIGGAQRLVGSVLSIKPVLHITDGRIEPMASIRTKKKAIIKVLETVCDDAKGHDKVHMAVIDASNRREAEFIVDQLRLSPNPEELFRAELSPVVGTHAGPGTVGIAYYWED